MLVAGSLPWMSSLLNNEGILPSRELTYPTVGKGKSSSKPSFLGSMLIFRGVLDHG